MKRTHRIEASSSRIFLWIALFTAIALSIPLVAMQFTNDVNWDGVDFIVMGALVFGMSSLLVIVSRHLTGGARVAAAAAVVAAFLYSWAELAVGIFTNLGS